jgi:hypothetical protein
MAQWADAAHRIARRRLDLDDVGAHVAKNLRGIGRHEHGRQLDDLHALERSAHDATFDGTFVENFGPQPVQRSRSIVMPFTVIIG